MPAAVLTERLCGDLVELEGIAVTADECVTSLQGAAIEAQVATFMIRNT